jgi:CRP/FNR family transcriptional regulator, cyclic AMP receptor protein
MPQTKASGASPRGSFDLRAFLHGGGLAGQPTRFRAGAVLFEQGAVANSVFYVEAGAVKLSVLSPAGKEAVVAILGPRDFFGEGCLTGQPLRMGTATAVMPTTAVCIPKPEMVSALSRPEFSQRFIAHMLERNIRIEEDLIDQLFNSTEKRLARALMLLGRFGEHDATHQTLPRLSQETLAEIVGTTRSRVNFFMNKFRKLGLIEYNGVLKIHQSLMDVILHD